MQVPVYQDTARPQAPASAPIQTFTPPPAAAFGAGTDEALSRLGDTVEKIGDVVGQHVIQQADAQRQLQVIDAHTKFRQAMGTNLLSSDVDPKTKAPVGLLNRHMGQAKGATNELDQRYLAMRKSFIDSVGTPSQKAMLAKMMTESYAADRESVIRHEAGQLRENDKAVLDANLSQRATDMARVTDPKLATQQIDEAKAIQASQMARMGYPAEAITEAGDKLSSEMAANAIKPLLEKQAPQAKALFDGIKGKIPPDNAAVLQATIDGKMLDDKKDATWNAVKGMTLSDGFFDTGKAEQFVQTLPEPPKVKEELFNHVRSMGAVQDAEIKDKRAASERSFTNEAIESYRKGVPYQAALPIAAKYGYDQTDTLAKQEFLTQLYTGQKDPFDSWVEHQDPGTKLAWKEVEAMAEAKYPSIHDNVTLPGYPAPMPARDAFLLEMKEAAIGKKGDEIRTLAADKLKKVDVPWSWFGEVAWKRDTVERHDAYGSTVHLQKTYGDDMVSKAAAALKKAGRPVTATNLRYALEAANTPKKGGSILPAITEAVKRAF